MGPTLEIEDQLKGARANSPVVDGTRQVLADFQTVERVSSESPYAEPGQPVPSPRKKSRLAKRIAIIVGVVALTTLAYIKRATLFYPPANNGASASQALAAAERKVLYWVDPMHPNYKADKPGTAPDCGMDLVPVYADGEQMKTNLPDGAFKISSEKQQLIGVTYGIATYQPVSRTMRTVGRLAYDETKINHVHTKIEGWIEDVYVDFTGKFIEKGRPLLTVYSPDLLQTQQEYLLALRGRGELGTSPFKEASAGANSLYESARRRLELWDVSEAEIKELERTGKPAKSTTLYAPATGFVLTRNAFTKQRVMPDTDLYSIADLSSIWVLADIYEYEASDISVGQTATVTLPYLPGRQFKGKVTYIYPQVDAVTRTLKARIEVANPRFELKPDMYANVEFKIDYGKHVVVPQESVLDSGSEQTVFVALDDGYFAPRKVAIGAKLDGKVIVLSGLKPGARIVTSGNFLIDSESRMKSAASGMSMPGMDHGGAAPAGTKVPQQIDHSHHQPSSTAKPEQEDHSKHQAKPDQQRQMQDASVQHSPHQSTSDRKVLYWYDPMHPNYKADKPGKAPDCGMDLVPKYADEKQRARAE